MKHVLPETWVVDAGEASVGGVPLAALADEFGTPLFVMDERHLMGRLRAFREAFGEDTSIVYAGKAFLCGALIRLLDSEGWMVDAVSGGELACIRRAGFPLSRAVLHGNATPESELRAALEHGIGRVVVDHPGEAESLARLALMSGDRSPVAGLLRLNVPLDPETHEKVKTVGPTAHFGMEPHTAAEVARAFASARGIRWVGAHIHVGSQIRDLGIFQRAAAALVDFVEPIRDCFATPVELDLGGGLAVPYLEEDDVPTPREYGEAVRQGLERARATERLGDVRLLVEPGRSVVANAGVTLYRVQASKHLEAMGDILAVDGGFSDNPRPSLYGARYEVLSGSWPDAPHERPFRVVGRHCESGDVVSARAPLPAQTDRGDLLVLPATGAYAYSMSSRYNGIGRPPVVFVRDGQAREVVRRETHGDLVACDLALAPTT